jgi:hypothetical protein
MRHLLRQLLQLPAATCCYLRLPAATCSCGSGSSFSSPDPILKLLYKILDQLCHKFANVESNFSHLIFKSGSTRSRSLCRCLPMFADVSCFASASDSRCFMYMNSIYCILCKMDRCGPMLNPLCKPSCHLREVYSKRSLSLSLSALYKQELNSSETRCN